jgi:hypothetical protein
LSHSFRSEISLRDEVIQLVTSTQHSAISIQPLNILAIPFVCN